MRFYGPCVRFPLGSLNFRNIFAQPLQLSFTASSDLAHLDKREGEFCTYLPENQVDW
jgi:hypothetical protein